MCNRLCDKRRPFIMLVRNYARAHDLIAVLGTSQSATWKAMRGRSKAKFRLSREALLQAWETFTRGEALRVEALVYMPQRATGKSGSRRGVMWTPGDMLYIRQAIGTRPIAQIAEELGRTRLAIFAALKAYKLSKLPFTNTVANLARDLGLHPATVSEWCMDSRIESYLEVRWRIVHKRDADWLRKYYQWGVQFEEFPGCRSDQQREKVRQQFKLTKLQRPAYTYPRKEHQHAA